jgi:hypothetical protein
LLKSKEQYSWQLKYKEKEIAATVGQPEETDNSIKIV